MHTAVADLVVLDDDEARDGRRDGDVIEARVPVCAVFLLLLGMSWLKDENSLDEEEDSGGVEEL